MHSSARVNPLVVPECRSAEAQERQSAWAQVQGVFVTEHPGDQTAETPPAEFDYDPLAPDPPSSNPAAPMPTPAVTDESTVGTGTSIALGCVVATVLLIVIALVILGINAAIR